jgi:hypothetical protein
MSVSNFLHILSCCLPGVGMTLSAQHEREKIQNLDTALDSWLAHLRIIRQTTAEKNSEESVVPAEIPARLYETIQPLPLKLDIYGATSCCSSLLTVALAIHFLGLGLLGGLVSACVLLSGLALPFLQIAHPVATSYFEDHRIALVEKYPPSNISEEVS